MHFFKAAYRPFTWWSHGPLGMAFRLVLPSCAVQTIRNAFPQDFGGSLISDLNLGSWNYRYSCRLFRLVIPFLLHHRSTAGPRQFSTWLGEAVHSNSTVGPGFAVDSREVFVVLLQGRSFGCLNVSNDTIFFAAISGNRCLDSLDGTWLKHP